MADTNLTQLRYIEEVNWGVTPGTPAMQEARITSETLGNNLSTTRSNEIRSDRQITDLILTGVDPAGDVAFELSYGAHDDWMEGALFSDWVGVGGGATEIITSGATGSNIDFSLNSTSGTIMFGSSVTHEVVAGQWIRLNGSAADDGYHLVSAVSGQTLTVASITTTEVLDETDAATIKGARLRNGTTTHSYSIERKVDTDTDQFFIWPGAMVSKLALDVKSQDVLTGTFSFIMESETASTSETADSVVDATTADIMSSAANVANVLEDGATISGVYVQSISFSLDNGLRGIKDITSTGNAKIGTGSCDVTGALDLIFDDLVIYNKFANSESSSLAFRSEDGETANEGNCYVYTFHKIKYSTGAVTTPGLNQDLPQAMGWQALRHPTYDCTIQIDRFAAE